MEGLVKADIPTIPIEWEYDGSIAKVKPLIMRWKNITLDIAVELYIAREILSGSKFYGNQWSGTNVPQQTWEQYCEAIGLEKRTANRWLAAVFGPQKFPSPAFPQLESQVLYADPPWAFSNAGFDQSAARQYPVMELEDICSLKDKTGKSVRKLTSEKRSVLFLWVPEALIPEGLEVIKSWGFEYKAQLIWVKDKSPGIGWWVNSKHEILCISSKGEDLHPSIKYDSVFEAPVTKHSQKPEQVYEMIEAMYTGPYIELFARNKRKGWEVWGNQIPQIVQ